MGGSARLTICVQTPQNAPPFDHFASQDLQSPHVRALNESGALFRIRLTDAAEHETKRQCPDYA